MENKKAKEIIEKLQLIPHPEGGYYREIFRSKNFIALPETGAKRRAATTIYFLLEKGQVSRFHKISPEEIWHFYNGASLELYMYDETGNSYNKYKLDTDEIVRVVPSNCWQAARTTGEYTLVGCTVAPAFEFSDFHFMENANMIDKIKAFYPELSDLI